MAPLRQIARRTLIPQTGVEPLAIIEYFAIPEQIQLSFGAGGIPLMLRQLAFECGPEALHRGIIVATARSTHAHRDPGLNDQRLVGVARVLCTLVRMVPGTRPSPTPGEGGMEGGAHEVGGLGRCRCPSDHRASSKVEHTGDVEITFIGCYRRDVADPPPIRLHNVELAVQKIRGHMVATRPRGTRSPVPTPRPLWLELPQPHQPSDMVAAERGSGAGQGRPQPAAPVPLTTGGLNGAQRR